MFCHFERSSQQPWNIPALHACQSTYMFYHFEWSSQQPWNIPALHAGRPTYIFYHFKQSSPQPWNIFLQHACRPTYMLNLCKRASWVSCTRWKYTPMYHPIWLMLFGSKPGDYSWNFLPHPHQLLLILPRISILILVKVWLNILMVIMIIIMDNLALIRRPHPISMAGTLQTSFKAWKKAIYWFM